MILFNHMYQNKTLDPLTLKLGVTMLVTVYFLKRKYQKAFTAVQLVELVFYSSKALPAGINAYGIMCTNKLISFGCDGVRHFDLI